MNLANYPSLSSNQNNILTYIEQFTALNGIPPTIREIQAGCGISSTSVVDYNLNILCERGYIRWIRSTARGILLPSKEEAETEAGQLKGAIREAIILIRDSQRYKAAVEVLSKALAGEVAE
jgi:SOS-response transcriptional repressor LexA